MCTISAAVTGGLSVAQGYAGWQRQQAQYSNNKALANAQRQQQRNQYNSIIAQQNQEWDNTLKIWAQERQQFKEQVQRNYDAAYGYGGAYQGLQMRTNDAFTEAAFSAEDSLRATYKTLGFAQASGQTGKTADRFDQESLMNFGIDSARRAKNLTRSIEGQMLDAEGVRRQLETANNQAYQRVAVAPVPGRRPLPPTLAANPVAPSPWGAIVETGQGLFGAAKAGGLFGQNQQWGEFGVNFNPQTGQVQ